MINQFKKYVNTFDFNDKNIEKKYYHSLRVKSLCKLISKDIGFNNEEVKIAEVAGLLHDYGRFMQWSKYHTFKDYESIDHGDYGASQLFDKNEIVNYLIDEKKYAEIYNAIKYHNKISLPKDLPERSQTLCKIVRDADKLDIMYLYSSQELIFPEEGEISSVVKKTFDNETLINKKDEISGADHGITDLAFIYDLNFTYSFKHLKRYKIIEQIYENLKDKEKFKYYFEKIVKYIDAQIKE